MKLDEFHQRLADLNASGADDATVTAMLRQCPKGECGQCGQIVCPSHEPLHFHHDGCPACDVHEWEPTAEELAEWYADHIRSED